MVYSRLRVQYFIRMLFILLTAGYVTYFFQSDGISVLFLVFVSVLFIQIQALLHVLERPQRDMVRFFQAIEYSDFAQTFSFTSKDKSLQPLRVAFDRVIQVFQNTRAEKEAHFRYLQTIVQHVGIGIIVFKEDGKIDLINPLAKKILGMPQLKQIDQLSYLDSNLPKILFRLESGERTQIQVKGPESGDLITLSLYATHFILQSEQLTLISVQNIQSELEEKELEAWQNLIRVLTHEIMNSITPISSLASTANQLLGNISENIQKSQKIDESVEDITQAIKTIESRSQGLLRFVESYRELTRIPKPEFEIVSIRELFRRVVPLMRTKFNEGSIKFTQSIEPESLEITADVNLIEQVLINLLQNALDWAIIKPDGEIRLSASMGNLGRPIIQITDNGPGIQKEALEKIFIPFFTTKPKGSGVGLSLSRQIMHLHHGSITAVSEPDQNTVFTLKF
jgi:two-component system, NtrC family, nitrogen regulation sensor histidine kinase NtrY